MDLSWQSSNIKFCRNIKNADPAPLWLPKLDWKKIYLWLDEILTCNSVITNTSLSNEIIISEMMTNQVSMRPKLNPNINLLINERKVQKNLNNLKTWENETFCSVSIILIFQTIKYRLNKCLWYCRFQQDYHFISRYSIDLCRRPLILVKLYNYLKGWCKTCFGKTLAMLTRKRSSDFQNNYLYNAALNVAKIRFISKLQWMFYDLCRSIQLDVKF